MSRSVSRRAQKLWDRLTSWYGARIAEQYGKHPPADWAELFDRTDDERIETALLDVRRATPAFPPTLGQLEAAIPKRDRSAGGPSRAEQSANLMIERHGSEMCIHQLARPWNYFGPLQEFVSKNRGEDGNEIVTHPAVRGVQVADCKDCGKPTFRVLNETAVSTGVAA